MAHFYVECQGSRGAVHRLGGKDGGGRTDCRGWELGVDVQGAHEDGHDVFYVHVNGGSNHLRSGRMVMRVDRVDTIRLQRGVTYTLPDGTTITPE